MSLRQEFAPMLRLAIPVVLSDLGWMSMGIVDTMMVGRITPGTAVAMGAVSIGSIFYYTIAMLGVGLMLGLDTLVSRAYGAGQRDECRRWLLDSLYLTMTLAPLLMLVVWLGVPLFRVFRYEPALFDQIGRFLRALVWGTPPLFVYFAVRRYLQATNRVGPVVFALVTANLVNLVGNWILIYGHLGAPALGIVGSAWSTTAARAYMAAVLGAYVLVSDRPWHIPLRPHWARIRELLRLGSPAAAQITFEIGVFATAGALIGKLGDLPLAAHQIALQTVSATYMVPLGINSAAAVRVGQALGRRDGPGAAHAGWAAILIGAAFMSCCGVALVAMPRAIGRVFTTDGRVVEAAVSLLAVGALFQLFDGLQTCAMGALRGAGDTRTPMLAHLLAYWIVGLPVGYVACFELGHGAAGMWAGLCTALILIGVALVIVWRRTAQGLEAGNPSRS